MDNVPGGSTNNSSSLILARQSLERLKSAILDLKKNNYAYFDQYVLPAFQDARNQIEALISGDTGQADIELLKSELKDARFKLSIPLLEKIKQAVQQVENTGESQEANQWVSALESIGGHQSISVSSQIEKARRRFEIFDNARQLYKDTIEKFQSTAIEDALKRNAGEAARERLADAEMDLQGKFALESLEQTDEKVVLIQKWQKDIVEKLDPYILRQSLLNSVATATLFEDQLRDLQRSKDLKLDSISYYKISDDLTNLEMAPMSPADAENICLSRWRVFSRQKINEYIADYEKFLLDKNESIYSRDPRSIQKDFLPRIERVLRPIDELDVDTQQKYRQFYHNLDTARRMAVNLEMRMDGVNTLNADKVQNLHALDEIGREIKMKAPYLISDFESKRANLVDLIRLELDNDLERLKGKFKFSIEQSGQDANQRAIGLTDVEDFKNLQIQFQNLSVFCKKTKSRISDVEILPPQEALAEIAKIETGIRNESLPIPVGLADLADRLRRVSEAVGNIDKLINPMQAMLEKTVEKINTDGTIPGDEDLLTVIAQKADIDKLLSIIQPQVAETKAAQTETDEDRFEIRSVQKAADRLTIYHRILARIEAYLNAFLELDRPGADLKKVEDCNKVLSQPFSSGIKSLDIRPAKILDITLKLNHFKSNDGFVNELLIKIYGGLKPPYDLKKLLDLWTEIERIEATPTTLVIERAKRRTDLESILQREVNAFLTEFNNSPRGKDLTTARSAQNWHQKNLDHSVPIDITGALCEAEAWTALFPPNPATPVNYPMAYTNWKKAENANRPNAKSHRLAVLKLLAIIKVNEGDITYLKKAMVDPDLQNDANLCALAASLDLKAIDHRFEDLDVIKLGKGIEEFEKVIAKVAKISVWNIEEGTETSDKDKDPIVELESGVENVWQEGGYQTLLDKAGAAILPKPAEVREEADYRRIIYSSLSHLFQKVTEDSSLHDLEGGKKAAEGINAEKTWLKKGSIATLLEKQKALAGLFEEKWNQYRKLVLMRIQTR